MSFLLWFLLCAVPLDPERNKSVAKWTAEMKIANVLIWFNTRKPYFGLTGAIEKGLAVWISMLLAVNMEDIWSVSLLHSWLLSGVIRVKQQGLVKSST